jgi:tRNA dimethylallyltransferase
MSWDAVLIAGPTASGKSALALSLAERLNGAIVNTDSMQVYRELRVLTARPSVEDEARVPHFLYGHVPVDERYSAGRFQEEAAAAFAEARAKKRVPIFTGGTGLYFGVLTGGLSPVPPVPEAVRNDVRERRLAMGPSAFFTAFAARDPETAAALRPEDTQRVLRASAVLEATGRSLRFWQKKPGIPLLKNMKVARFVIAPPRDALVSAIEARVQRMVETGGIDEAQSLTGIDPSLPAARALGVPQLQAYLAGEVALDAAIAGMQAETRRYAKRQMTWFRRFMKDWKWVEDGALSNFVSQWTRTFA